MQAAVDEVYNVVPQYHAGPADYSEAPGYDYTSVARTANEQANRIEAVLAMHHLPGRVTQAVNIGETRVFNAQLARNTLDNEALVDTESKFSELEMPNALGVPEALVQPGGIGQNVVEFHIAIPIRRS